MDVNDILYKHFELLFFNEPKVLDNSSIVDHRFRIVKDKNNLTRVDIINVLQLEFAKIRKNIDEENDLLGGSITSLTHIKRYINNKIKHIIPRD